LTITAAYLEFDRATWATLGAQTPLTLAEAELEGLQGVNEPVSLAEVEAIYLPVVRLLSLIGVAGRERGEAVEAFLRAQGRDTWPSASFGRSSTGPRTTPPFVIGIAGSVAVGKSTFARVLRTMLTRVPGEPRVDLVATDGFLFPNHILEARGLLGRKGFPESYDVRRLVVFLEAIRAGHASVRAPVYSHQAYDIVPGEAQIVDRPDVVILEGLNVLQPAEAARRVRIVVSAFFDFSIYIDADEDDIESWYVARFLALRQTVFRDPRAYFHRYAALSDDQARATAREIWRTINGVNLRQNIAPTRERAHLRLEKGPDHAVRRVRLRP
jgi:type I pantothenate kinase